MNEEEINEIVKEHYGFTIDEIDNSVGYWCTKFTEERTKRKHLEHNWNELKKWLESESSNSIYATGHLTAICMVLNKMQELEEGGNND